jgi:branched-chain amino acid transport system ATP-binding protein
MTLLSAQGVFAGYGEAAVVRNLHLEVNEGEVVALLGPNGAGKSTTLKALSGTIPVEKGEVTWNGRSTRSPLHRRARQGLAYVTEERCIFSRLSVRDNIKVGHADPTIVESLFPELGKRIDLKAGDLSGGEQQMLAVGRAIGRSPKLLFADELSLGLAPIVVDRLLEVVRRQADEGLGVLMVEQHARLVLDIADRVYVMRGGEVRMSGTAVQIKDKWTEVENSYLGAGSQKKATSNSGI